MHRIPRNSEVSIISKTVASSSEFPVYFIVNKGSNYLYQTCFTNFFKLLRLIKW